MRVVHITLDVYNTNSPRKVSLVGQSWGLGIAVIEKTLYHALRIFWAPGSAWRGSIKSVRFVRLYVCTSLCDVFLSGGFFPNNVSKLVQSRGFWCYWKIWSLIFLHLVYNESLYYLPYSCINSISGKNLVPEISAEMKWWISVSLYLLIKIDKNLKLILKSLGRAWSKMGMSILITETKNWLYFKKNWGKANSYFSDFWAKWSKMVVVV